MQFLLIIAHDNLFSPTKDLTKDIIAWNAEMKKLGILKYSNPLVPFTDSVTIRIREKKTIKTNGSFSNSKEKIAAYALIECNSMDDAVEFAEKHPIAKLATIEIRPVWENLSSI
jgi:hypothetical protein